ncbi:type II toxin-antitoxin system RelE/ParE family toxin [Marivirga sp. S37H4]|uniref:Type II toxin-antitoxin system RelE/ParE family toxin n=1 Tax=Marivirga aurantiaca TaxID=2802615 RepID=A0A934X128_9BACT|nr:type II toxin-antitoxin system RelE/ParE family toxin [Marivirga aurantiaca]MBK6266386.1 type II toxin-antitoxin system RelE/ParE family toxin [Marivirga aurantiaca]
MKVILTEQSLIRLEKSLRFYLEELEIPEAQVIKIKNRLIGKAKTLSKSPHKGQYEPYLSKLKQGHRRLIEGNFKIIYRVEGNTIYIVDFFDSRDDPKKMKG